MIVMISYLQCYIVSYYLCRKEEVQEEEEELEDKISEDEEEKETEAERLAREEKEKLEKEMVGQDNGETTLEKCYIEFAKLALVRPVLHVCIAKTYISLSSLAIYENPVFTNVIYLHLKLFLNDCRSRENSPKAVTGISS